MSNGNFQIGIIRLSDNEWDWGIRRVSRQEVGRIIRCSYDTGTSIYPTAAAAFAAAEKELMALIDKEGK